MSRTSKDHYKDGRLYQGYDYKNQAWVKDGVYVRCGHPEEMDCGCYGRLHEGEQTELIIKVESPPMRQGRTMGALQELGRYINENGSDKLLIYTNTPEWATTLAELFLNIKVELIVNTKIEEAFQKLPESDKVTDVDSAQYYMEPMRDAGEISRLLGGYLSQFRKKQDAIFVLEGPGDITRLGIDGLEAVKRSYFDVPFYGTYDGKEFKKSKDGVGAQYVRNKIEKKRGRE